MRFMVPQADDRNGSLFPVQIASQWVTRLIDWNEQLAHYPDFDDCEEWLVDGMVGCHA
jgi:hypothetical protein